MDIDTEMQWLDYRMARSNAIWFCQQYPMRTENTDCTAKDLKKNTEEWVSRTRELWAQLMASEHPSALSVARQHVLFKIQTGQETTTIAGDVDNTGLLKCLCPECMIDEIKRVQNPELNLAL